MARHNRNVVIFFGGVYGTKQNNEKTKANAN